MDILILLIIELLYFAWTRNARRRVIAWLQQLNFAQKELLTSCLDAAKTSSRRTFQRPIRRGEPEPFRAQCALLVSTRAVTVASYASKGVRHYRLDPWLYDYLQQHPELLEIGSVSPSATMVESATKLARGVRP